jgi:hypothetical protein
MVTIEPFQLPPFALNVTVHVWVLESAHCAYTVVLPVTFVAQPNGLPEPSFQPMNV